jgi:hypothetical protein
MYLFNSTEWCYIKRTTDNVLQILLQASRWRVKTANTILQIPWKKVKFNTKVNPTVFVLDIYYNYTLYKNAGFWLVNSRDIFLQIQALHCEFAECLLHVGVW